MCIYSNYVIFSLELVGKHLYRRACQVDGDETAYGGGSFYLRYTLLLDSMLPSIIHLYSCWLLTRYLLYLIFVINVRLALSSPTQLAVS